MKEFKNFLTEKLLSSQFKIGFELEACIKNVFPNNPDRFGDVLRGTKIPKRPLRKDFSKKEKYEKAIKNYLEFIERFHLFYEYDKDHFPKKLLGFIKNFWGITEDDSVMLSNYIVNDSSVTPYSVYDMTFEFKLPKNKLLDVTPENLLKIVKFLMEIKKYKVYTNESCGFHFHISFEGITDYDLIWLNLNMAIDEKFINRVQYINTLDFSKEYDNKKTDSFIKLFSDEYAKTNYLDFVRDDFNKVTKYNKSVTVPAIMREIRHSNKYSLFRAHPLGTMEWRGPRDFMGREQSIKNVLNLLYYIVYWMSKVLDKDQLVNDNGVVLNKTEFQQFTGGIIKIKTPREQFEEKYFDLIKKGVAEKVNLKFIEQYKKGMQETLDYLTLNYTRLPDHEKFHYKPLVVSLLKMLIRLAPKNIFHVVEDYLNIALFEEDVENVLQDFFKNEQVFVKFLEWMAYNGFSTNLLRTELILKDLIRTYRQNVPNKEKYYEIIRKANEQLRLKNIYV